MARETGDFIRSAGLVKRGLGAAAHSRTRELTPPLWPVSFPQHVLPHSDRPDYHYPTTTRVGLIVCRFLDRNSYLSPAQSWRGVFVFGTGTTSRCDDGPG